METAFWTLFKEYGLLGLMCCAVIVLFFFVLKWVLKFVATLINQFNLDRESWLKQAAEERCTWQKSLDRQTEAWLIHNEQAKLFHDTVQEAHKFQREEHAEMIKSLGRINGYKND